MTIIDCSTVMAAPQDAMPDSGAEMAGAHHASSAVVMGHGEMACCDTAAPPCCEPVSLALPSNFESPDQQDFYLQPSVFLASMTSYSSRSSIFSAPRNWRLHAPPQPIHLLNCSFLN
ncbi:MAG: hypothetical protein V7720_08145 [Halioglobus sp.]